MNAMEEIWKDIEGWEGLYQVSNMGRVKSLPRWHDAIHPYITREKILSPRVSGKDREYLAVALCKNCYRKQEKIHKLVAKAFVPNPHGYKEVNHINEIKGDNRAVNLEWCSRSYNINYGSRAEKQKKNLTIPVLQFSIDGKFLREYSSMKSAGDSVGRDSSNISRAVRNNRVCAGFLWRNK